jgi:hypothetical protein
MELEDLKRRWEDHDRKLDAVIRLNASLVRGSALSRAATATTRLSRLLLVELLLDLVLVVWLGSFIADHITQPRFLIPALALDLGAIALVRVYVLQWAALRSLDYSAPIVAIQKRLGALQVQRVRAVKWVLLTAPLVWTPMLIVGLKGLLGVDAYAILPHAWLAANLAFGAALIPLAVWIARRSADRMERSPLVQRILRDLAGYNLNAAVGFLGSLARFEEEESPA